MSEADTESAPSLLPPTPVESAVTEEVPTPMPDEVRNSTEIALI